MSEVKCKNVGCDVLKKVSGSYSFFIPMSTLPSQVQGIPPDDLRMEIIYFAFHFLLKKIKRRVLPHTLRARKGTPYIHYYLIHIKREENMDQVVTIKTIHSKGDMPNERERKKEIKRKRDANRKAN